MREPGPDSHLTPSERKRTSSILKAELCECKTASGHCCTDKVIRCQARMTWHFDRGWPDAPDPSRAEKAKRKKFGIQYTPKGKRIHDSG